MNVLAPARAENWRGTTSGGVHHERGAVVYVTKSGSTREVADAVARVLRDGGLDVKVRQPRDVGDVEVFDSVILRSPILYGGPRRELRAFIRDHRDALDHRPTAFFLTCMELTDVPDTKHPGLPIVVDPLLARPPATPGKLTVFERTHLPSDFIDRLLAGAPEIMPISIGIFAGKLDYATLDPVSRLAMKMIWRIYHRAPEGDRRNWDAIHTWAENLLPHLPVSATGTD